MPVVPQGQGERPEQESRAKPGKRRRGAAQAARQAWAGRVLSELAEELPDEDIGEHLDDCLDFYRRGSRQPCEESEYLEMLRDAQERMESGY
ncbi:hypothetical protein GTW43_08415 [Streptomyces sp. SID5785]|nr:hypothetical protein [Streptomyces sp. SID5785]